LAVDAQDHLYVASGNAVWTLDNAGQATALPLSAPTTTDVIYDLTFDATGRLLLAHGQDGVLRFLPSGQLDAQLGLPGAHRVLCPPAGTCWAIGQALVPDDGYVSRVAP
jgi:hypothetical protein